MNHSLARYRYWVVGAAVSLAVCVGSVRAEAPTTAALELVGAERLPPGMASALEALLAHALESRGGYDVVPREDAPVLELRIKVDGRGPWKLMVRGTQQGGERARRFSTGKLLLSDRDGLIEVVDQLASSIHDEREGGPETAPLPIAEALSASREAVDRFLGAVEAIRSGDTTAGRALLRETPAIDPDFALAAAESAYLELMAGEPEAARRVLGLDEARPGAPGVSVGRHARFGMRALVERRPRVARIGAALQKRGGAFARWGRIIEGLAPERLKREPEQAVRIWEEIVAADPRDGRAHMGLGLARMSAGRYAEAIEAFERTRELWPDLLYTYSMQAECHARRREMARARAVLQQMKALAREIGAPSSTQALNPDLLLGSVDLMEGHFEAALERFEDTLAQMVEAGVTGPAVDALHRTVVGMRRDNVRSSDPLRLKRQLARAREALAAYEESLTADELEQKAALLLRLKGMISVRKGDTVEAWRIVEQIKARGKVDEEYEHTYLAAATMLKEGDLPGAISAFARLVELRGLTVDRINLAQLQRHAKRYAEARAGLEEVERLIVRYTGSWPPRLDDSPRMFLSDPHLAAKIPAYHYHRARLAYLTGEGAESQKHFNRLLGYYRQPDEQFQGMVAEAYARGARPE